MRQNNKQDMKILRYTYLIVMVAVTVVMAACSSDTDTQDPSDLTRDGMVQVRLRIKPASSSPVTRWSDTNANDDEMMNIWTVYCVDNDPTSDRYGKLVFIHIGMPIDDNREIDDLVYLPKGKYAFYSFANIHPTETNSLMGIAYDPKKLRRVNRDGSLGTEEDFYYGNYPDPENPGNNVWRDFFEISDDNPHKGVVYDMKWVGNQNDDTYEFKYHEDNSGKDIGRYTYTVDGVDGFQGNGLDLTATNCFSSKGIPMSNYQEIDIDEQTVIDLIVVRMVAKIELQLTNQSSSSIKINSATLSDVTQDGAGQICIFPNLNNVGTATQNEMSFTHKDIRPHLSDNATVAGYTHPINKTIAAGTMETVTFYVNESKAPTNASGLFYLTLGIDNGGSEVEYRHALINQKGKNSDDDNAWDYIARNDYRIIPVTLTDWQFRVEPIAFVPIAGYPATTLSSDALTATFSTGGYFILQPFAKKATDGVWRDFSDPEVTFVSMTMTGDTGMFETVPVYDTTTQRITGVLDNDIATGTYKTALTINVKLGPSSGTQYDYSFTCNVVLQK